MAPFTQSSCRQPSRRRRESGDQDGDLEGDRLPHQYRLTGEDTHSFGSLAGIGRVKRGADAMRLIESGGTPVTGRALHQSRPQLRTPHEDSSSAHCTGPSPIKPNEEVDARRTIRAVSATPTLPKARAQSRRTAASSSLDNAPTTEGSSAVQHQYHHHRTN